MKVLFVHNHYVQRSGEDGVYELDRRAALRAGHALVSYTRDNRELAEQGLVFRLSLAARTVWAWDTQRELRRLIEHERPALAHFVNTLPLISPAAFLTCQRLGVRVVYNVQNYRLSCPAATHVRDGAVCMACDERGLSSSVRYGCYRGSRAATFAVALTTQLHRALGTFEHAVDRFMVPSRFMAQLLIEHAGLDARKLVVRPNAVDPDPDPGPRDAPGRYLLFVGRFVEEKGLLTLLDAYAALRRELGNASPPLKLVGTGPLAHEVERRLRSGALPGVERVGSVSHDRALSLIAGALSLIVPSQWYEGLPLSLLEAFACGVPVVAARIGSLGEVVSDGANGLLHEPGRASDLARVLMRLIEAPELAQTLAAQGRATYLERHTLEHSARTLDAVYRELVPFA